MKRKSVDYEKFVEVWQKAKSAEEAAVELGMKGANARVVAGNLRVRGVPLKMFKRGRKPLDIAKLTKIAKASLK